MLLGLLSAGLTLANADAARWIVDQGGSLETGAGSRITGVRLGFAWVTDADLDRLSGLRDLRKLDLSLSLITDLGMERLKPLDTVTDLNLSAVERITDAGISYIHGWKNLERLNLRGTDITDTTLQQYIPHLTNLRSLDISYTQVTNTGLESLAALRNLEELALGANKINGSGLHVLKLLPRLKRLSLNGRQPQYRGLVRRTHRPGSATHRRPLAARIAQSRRDTDDRFRSERAESTHRIALARSEPNSDHE